MSKIPPQQLLDAVKSVLAPTKPRKFLESVDLQVNLKNYDTQKDKRFSGSRNADFNDLETKSTGVAIGVSTDFAVELPMCGWVCAATSSVSMGVLCSISVRCRSRTRGTAL
jgi:hypothetical protein